MLQIDSDGNITVNETSRGTVWSPGAIHPESKELVSQWKQLHEISSKVDPSLFQVTAGDDYDKASVRLRFGVPHESWKTAHRVDRDLRQLWNDMLDAGWQAELDTEFAWDEPTDSIWTLSILWTDDLEQKDLERQLVFLRDAIRNTRLEEYLISSKS